MNDSPDDYYRKLRQQNESRVGCTVAVIRLHIIYGSNKYAWLIIPTLPISKGARRSMTDILHVR